MKYVNTKTGSVIVTDCEISGGDWEPVKEKNGKKPVKEEKDKEQ